MALCFFNSLSAQVVNIPDANFKKMLLSTSTASTIHIARNSLGNALKIDANDDGQIQTSELAEVAYLYFQGSQIVSLIGIKSFVNLKVLDCSYSKIVALDLSGMTSLKEVSCNYNALVSLNVSGLTNLEKLSCNDNKLTTLEANGLTKLKNLYCNRNKLTLLNISGLVNLETLACEYNEILSLDLNGMTNLTGVYVNNNKLSSLNISSSVKIIRLICNNNFIKSLDVKGLFMLDTLNCADNQIESLNVTSVTNLKDLYCYNNQLSVLNLSGLYNLESLSCGGNKLKSLNVNNLTKLTDIWCANNLLSTLVVNNLTKLGNLNCASNQLETIYNKNGSYEYFVFKDNPNLKYICADSDQITNIQNMINLYGYSNCHVNSYCSFTPGGQFYTIQGNIKIDTDNNGCSVSDINFSNLELSFSDGSNTSNFICNSSGKYNYSVQAGSHIIKPIIENPSYFNIYPSTVNVTFPKQTSLFRQDFCVTSNGVHPDLEITLLPIKDSRPGFDAEYIIVYKNKGNQTQSGSVNLTFDDATLDFISANPVATTQIVNSLSWNFTNLKPFESREIAFTLNVNSPMETPAVNNGDVLKFVATIISQGTDETPIDNTFTLNQTVVGSYDPNDKTCLEGNKIKTELIGQYVHYMIRFENTGTYQAQNIVVKDMIDLSKFDITTLVPTSSSHSYITKISEGNKVEFIFENINLPFDDANNDGYVAFKIKTLPTLKVGDSFTNEANIYFDYNFPILTNKATSKFETTLNIQDFEFSNYFKIYPVPAVDVLNISMIHDIEIQSIAVYDILGQMVIAFPNIKDTSKIDVSNLRTGNYFLKIKSNKGISSLKFIKK